MRYLFPIAIFAATAVLGACSDKAEAPVKATTKADVTEAPLQAEEGGDYAAFEELERSVDAANAARNGGIYIDCRTALNNVGKYKIEMVGGEWKIFAFETTSNSYIESKILLTTTIGRTTDNWVDVSGVAVTDDEITVSFRNGEGPLGRATINRSTGAMSAAYFLITLDQTCEAAQNHVQSRQF